MLQSERHYDGMQFKRRGMRPAVCNALAMKFANAYYA